MNSFSALIQALAVVILYISIGILLNKLGMITAKNRSGFTDFCLKVTLPCMVFKSFLGDMTGEMLKAGASVLLLSAGVHIFAWLVGGLLYKPFADNKKSIMKFALLVGNIGFVGLPLVTTAFGEMGSFYGSFYLIS
ncbi:MAG: AEC family transporter, partial [Clostridia bacterium]|nr:AEC family transporter [Clostridia bacterium]